MHVLRQGSFQNENFWQTHIISQLIIKNNVKLELQVRTLTIIDNPWGFQQACLQVAPFDAHFNFIQIYYYASGMQPS